MAESVKQVYRPWYYIFLLGTVNDACIQAFVALDTSFDCANVSEAYENFNAKF